MSVTEFPVLFTVPQVCRITQMSRSKIYELIASGEIPSIKIGRARRIPYTRFQEFLEAL